MKRFIFLAVFFIQTLLFAQAPPPYFNRWTVGKTNEIVVTATPYGVLLSISTNFALTNLNYNWITNLGNLSNWFKLPTNYVPSFSITATNVIGLSNLTANLMPVALSSTALTNSSVTFSNGSIEVVHNVKASNIWDRSNVKWWGAKGDGLTDDRPAIMLALAENIPLFFPSGTYRVSSPIEFTNRPTILYGDGKSVIWYLGAAYVPTAFTIGSTNLCWDSVIKDLEFRGNSYVTNTLKIVNNIIVI